MSVKFEPQRAFSQIMDKPVPGAYAIDGSVVNWYTCRETFANQFTEMIGGIYLSHEIANGEDIATFIAKTEEVIDIGTMRDSMSQNPFEPTLFALTNRSFALWIGPSQFWRCCPLRRSLFTIFLRCGALYDRSKDNYEDALFGVPYVTQTKDAVMRFLFGFTKYIPYAVGANPVPMVAEPGWYGCSDRRLRQYPSGWVNTFNNQDRSSIRQQLVRPELISPVEGISLPLCEELIWS